jgi:hypothetical protein
MLFIFSTPEWNRYLWQLKTAVLLHWYLIRGVAKSYFCIPKIVFNSIAKLEGACSRFGDVPIGGSKMQKDNSRWSRTRKYFQNQGSEEHSQGLATRSQW